MNVIYSLSDEKVSGPLTYYISEEYRQVIICPSYLYKGIFLLKGMNQVVIWYFTEVYWIISNFVHI